MRAFNFLHRSVILSAAFAAMLTGAACKREEASTGPMTLTLANASDLPAVYSPQQCANIIGQFPGWASVTPAPATDAEGRPTMFYAAITITNPIQLAELNAVGIQTDTMPMFTDDATRAKFDGQVGYVSKSTCGGAEIVWGMVPGPIFNLIAQDTVKFNETLVEAIVFLPVPDQVADASITCGGVHPISYSAAKSAGFRAPDDPPPSQAHTAQIAGLLGDIEGAASGALSDLKGAAKDVVGDGAKVYNAIKNGIPSFSGTVTCWAEDCVQVGVHLDIRNADSAFGGLKVAGRSDGTTPMVRAWGSRANQPLTMTGVQLTLRQSDDLLGFSWPISFSGSVQTDGTATVTAVTGKSSDFCITLENYAATLNDELTARQLCSFSHVLTTSTGAARPNTTFSHDDQVTLRLEDKYVNVMAQLTDGYDYLQQIVGYTPRKVKALSGPPLTLPPVKQLLSARAVTPCLNFPDVAVDALDAVLDSAGSLLAGPLGYLFAGAVESIYEDDMWLPDLTDTLTSRGIASHEYGHFAMCSLLYDEDPTKMVQIPSLTIQRILEGESVTATSEVAYIMEGWADFFAGQLVSGASYFRMENDLGRDGSMSYCRGDSTNGPCWDWNYVEDFNPASDGGSDSVGFDNQVRRVATTLFDAFDGEHPAPTKTATGAGGAPTFTGLGGFLNGALRPIANAVVAAIPLASPGNGDFWTQGDPTPIVPSSVRNGDAKDEVIALPGPGLRTLVHNWTHDSSALDWRVSQQQFFAALNATIRGTPAVDHPSRDYNWCEVCQMFAQHDGLSCTVTGNTSQGGLCLDAGNAATEPAMSTSEMVQVCTQSPTIPGFVGAPPAGSDPTSSCSFTGCPSHAILVGDVGDTVAACDACGPHQVSTGTHACGADVCATPNVSASTCVDCPDDQVVGGANGNTCVSCPALQIPNADRTACVPCGPHQIASDTTCVDCPNDQIASPNNTCQACPDGQMPYSDQGVTGPKPTFGESCMPTTECTCDGSACRTVNSNGICQDTIG